MYKKHKFLIGSLLVLLFAACDKEPILLDSTASVSIQGYSTADTVVNEMAVLTDSVITVKLVAKLNGQTARGTHHVRFGVDESKIALYRNKYGDALLLPYTSYLFYKSSCYIREGSSVSDSISLNIIRESLLRPYSTYVLPLVIESVDGQRDPVAPGEVMYLVLKAGKASVISKAEWKIASVSSDRDNSFAQYAIDNNPNTVWGTGLREPYPQHIVIDFAHEVTFSAVTDLPYSADGCPKRIQIELSMDGTNWTDKGIFDVEPDGNLQVMDTGISTARYMRFTILDATPFIIFSTILIKEISLQP